MSSDIVTEVMRNSAASQLAIASRNNSEPSAVEGVARAGHVHLVSLAFHPLLRIVSKSLKNHL